MALPSQLVRLGREGRLPTTVLAGRYEPTVARAVRAAWRAHQAAISSDRLIAAAAAGDEDGLVAALDPRAAARRLEAATTAVLGTAYLSGAEAAAGSLPGAKAPRLDNDLAAVHHEALAWARQHAAALVVGTEDTRRMVHALVVASQALQVPVRDLARMVYDVVGLNPRRSALVLAFETALRQEGVAAARIAARVARYADAQRRARALDIARTETIGALSGGQQALWDRAVARRLLDPRVLGKTWITTDDELLCPLCEALDGVVVPIGAEFAPGISGSPRHVSCRCANALAPLPRAA